jgi:hypothetical protein
MFLPSFLNENWHIKEILRLVTHMGANLGLFKSPNANTFISTGGTEPNNSWNGSLKEDVKSRPPSFRTGQVQPVQRDRNQVAHVYWRGRS